MFAQQPNVITWKPTAFIFGEISTGKSKIDWILVTKVLHCICTKRLVCRIVSVSWNSRKNHGCHADSLDVLLRQVNNQKCRLQCDVYDLCFTVITKPVRLCSIHWLRINDCVSRIGIMTWFFLSPPLYKDLSSFFEDTGKERLDIRRCFHRKNIVYSTHFFTCFIKISNQTLANLRQKICFLLWNNF